MTLDNLDNYTHIPVKRQYTEQHLRDILKKQRESQSLAGLAEEMEIWPPDLSRMIRGGRLSAKVVKFLGFTRVELFERNGKGE